MEVPTDHQASAHWGLTGAGADDLTGTPHLTGESYFHPAAGMTDGNPANSYYASPAAARAVHGYRAPHG